MKKIQAATIQETIVALTIIMICLSIGLMIFLNVVQSDKAWVQLKADMVLKESFFITKQEKSFFNEEYEYKSFVIKKVVEPYLDYGKLDVLHLSVLKENKTLASSKQLIIRYDNEQ